MAIKVKGKISSGQAVRGNVGKAETVIVQEVSFNTRFEFPSIGESEIMYVATDENKIYRFDENSLTYYCVGSDYNEIEVIQGTL